MAPIVTRNSYNYCYVILALSAFAFSFANGSCDPGPQQDFCVTVDDPFKGVFVNGKFCKNPENVTVHDFTFSGLDRPGNISVSSGSEINVRTESEILGPISLVSTIVRIDLVANGGMNLPHIHPRSAEIMHVTEGKIMAGFVTGRGNKYRLFVKILKKGQGMVIPHAMPHFQINVGKKPAVVFGMRNSQNPGYIMLSSSVFRTSPPINANIIAESYKITEEWARMIQSRFLADESLS
ncbi:hypothetical protein ACFE04_015089 [Oxalis oulophora]